MHQIGTYKGNPTITLSNAGGFPFTFGIEKAHLIIEHLAAIKEFISANPRNQTKRNGHTPSRNERILESGYQAYAREEGHE